MFKSQKLIVFSILLALVGIGATVAIGVGISVRDSVNPDKSSAAISDVVSNITGKVTCKTAAGTQYTKADMIRELSYALYVVDVSKPAENLGYTPYNGSIAKVNKDGTYTITGSAPKEYNFFKLGVKSSNVLATNCADFSKLVNDSGNQVCLNKELTKDITNLCGVTGAGYMCQRNLETSSFKGFDFALSNCPEPVLDLATTAISTSTAIEKNIGDTLTMYFNGEDLSGFNTLNTNYYIGQQGFSNIYSSYKVYLCENKADTTCKTEVISSSLSIPVVDVSPWSIIAKGKNIKIKVEGKLLTTAKANQPIKVQYAQLPGSIAAMTDSNGTNNVWNGSVSILSPAPVSTSTTTTVSSVSSVSSSISSNASTTSRTSSTSSSKKTTSSNGSVVSESSSTESTISTESSSSEESSFDSEYSTSSRSTSSIKPYVPVTTTPSNDNTTLLLALVALLVLFLISLFVVYRKYKSEKESKEVFTPSPLSETPPSSETPPTAPTV